MGIAKREHRYHYDAVVSGQRLRCALGVSNRDAAVRLENRITFALADGPKSPVWGELKNCLPPTTFRLLTAKAGVPLPPSLGEFQTKVFANLDARYKLGEIAASTYDNYYRIVKTFFKWLPVAELPEIAPDLITDYLSRRRQSCLGRGGNGRGVLMEAIVLKYIFNFAVEIGAVQKSPIKGTYRPNSEPPPPNPFTPQELAKMDGAEDSLWYLLMRWTGMRASDVAAVTWSSINWTTRELKWKTQKRGRWVQVPLAPPLYAALAACTERTPNASIAGVRRENLYTLVKKLGAKVGIDDAHPHRFRASLVTSLLGKGASLPDVAALIGDSPAVTAKHYAGYSDQQQERIKNLLEAA